MNEKRFSNKKSSRKAYVPRRLSPIQINLLKHIADYIDKNNYSPSYQCLAEMEAITPPSVFSRINTLIKLGYIVKEPNGRGFHIVRWDFLENDSVRSDHLFQSEDSGKSDNTSKPKSLLQAGGIAGESDRSFSEGKRLIQKAPHSNIPRPLGEVVSIPVLGWVQAGAPFEADNCRVGEIFIDRSIADPNRCYALQTEGESMINIGIEPGDILIVRKQCVANSGEIVVAFVDDGLTVKTLYNNGQGIIELRPENESMSNIEIGPETNLQILGVVTAWMKYAQKGKVCPF